MKHDIKHKVYGFTLIEVMISTALIAIVLPVAFCVLNSFKWFSHEEDYKYALFQARNASKHLMKLPFDSIPPEVRTVPAEGSIRLSQSRIIPGSIKIFSGEREIENQEFSAHNDEITFRKGFTARTVVIEYKFEIPDSGEAVTVPGNPPYEVYLLNSPVKEIIEIKSFQGKTSIPVQSSLYSFDSKSGKLLFDKRYSGAVIECSYIGKRIGNFAKGCFLNDKLQITHTPTKIKAISIEEIYGQDINRFKISFIRVRE